MSQNNHDPLVIGTNYMFRINYSGWLVKVDQFLLLFIFLNPNKIFKQLMLFWN